MTMFNPPHPGELITDTLNELGFGVRDLARALHVSPSTAHRLMNGDTVVTPEMAVKLSAVLGSSAKFWLNLQDNYSLNLAESRVDTSGLQRLVAA